LDVSFWREFWRKNHIQGTIVNAGGTVAYFPSDNPYQYRAKFLGDRDLLREFVDAAHEENVAVMARMDINQATEELFNAHPDWFTRGLDGNPYKMGSRYITCINGGYYKEQIPAVMREIIEKYRPEALGDNSWTGSSSLICYCDNCKRMFKEYCGMDIPVKADFDDRAYRLWLQWSLKRRTETWIYFNKVVEEIGGEDCLWIGMLHPEFYPIVPLRTLYDEAQLTGYRKAHMVDMQSRTAINGFENNSMTGLMLHHLFGEDSLIIESMASYAKGKYYGRKAAGPPEEMRTWMRSGIAGGIVPSPHFIGGMQDDPRMYENCTPVMQWHKDNEQYLFDRKVISNVGIVWSKENLLFHGQSHPMENCFLPFFGFMQALIRKRIPYIPVNAFHIKQEMEKLDLLILPDLASMTDEQIDVVEKFVKLGKSVVITGATGMLDELGYPRDDLRLDSLFGITRLTKKVFTPIMPGQITFSSLGEYGIHNYMRLPALPEKRHEILNGLDGTDIVMLYSQYYDVRAKDLETVGSFIPPFPVYPPEFAYMDDDKKDSDTPVILAGDTPYGGRVVYMAADIDRRFGDSATHDQGDLLANAVRWALRDNVPFRVDGPGKLDCILYRQENRFIMHINNLSGLNEWPKLVEEYYPVGPVKVSIHVGDAAVSQAMLRQTGGSVPVSLKDGWATLTLDRIESHEMIVLE